MSLRNEKITELIKHLSARFLTEEGNNSSLITVTNVMLSSDAKYATIFFTVFPESLEKTALEFAKRKRPEFKKFFKDNSTIGHIPFFDFTLDLGEKNRQKIDALLDSAK